MFEELLAQSGLSLDRLQNFLKVAEAGSIAHAAGRDPSRQALISRQIRELESYFGVELTRRQGRGIEITEAGRDLAHRVRLHFQSLQDYRTVHGGGGVEVRIAAGNSVLEWWLAPRMGKLAGSKFTFTLTDLRTGEMVAALTDHRIDLAILRRNAVVQPLKSFSIGSFGYLLFVPPTLADVADADLPLALTLGGEFARNFARQATQPPPKVVFRCCSFTQAAELARQGVCAAILPETAHDRLGPGFQERPVPGLGTYRRELAVAWHQRMLDIRPELEEAIDRLRAASA